MILRAFPFMSLVVAAYNVLVLVLNASMDGVLFSMPLPSGDQWSMSLGDSLVAVSLLLLFVDMVGATSPRTATLVNHGLSTLVFTLCVIEFLLVAGFGTPTFFLITIFSLADVVAGYAISVVTARRDIAINDMGA